MLSEVNGSTQISSRFKLLQDQLHYHPLYNAINSKDNLKIFMEHHVYAVWDFMSLIKALQKHVAPISIPWTPPKSSRNANFINQLVLEEESDYALTDTTGSSHASHFESYLLAMEEIGADTRVVTTFINTVSSNGLEEALKLPNIPEPAKQFMRFTFELIEQNKPYLLAAALAFGREDLVPQLFRALQNGMNIDPLVAPNLCAYIQRHIQLDSEEHGPLVIQLLNELCEDSSQNQDAVANVAEQTLAVRLDFWDGIQGALQH